MAKQSVKHRTKRVHAGCCPVHGMGMGQVGLWRENGAVGYLLECFRSDCQVQAIQAKIGGQLQLTPKFRYLLAPAATAP